MGVSTALLVFRTPVAALLLPVGAAVVLWVVWVSVAAPSPVDRPVDVLSAPSIFWMPVAVLLHADAIVVLWAVWVQVAALVEEWTMDLWVYHVALDWVLFIPVPAKNDSRRYTIHTFNSCVSGYKPFVSLLRRFLFNQNDPFRLTRPGDPWPQFWTHGSLLYILWVPTNPPAYPRSTEHLNLG